MANLTSGERLTVINALYTAAEKYRECAKAVADSENPGIKSLSSQFDRQAAELMPIIEKLEEMGV